MAAIAAFGSSRFPGWRLALHAGVAGALLHGGYLGPVYWAIAHGMPAGVSALIVGLQPLMTAFMAHLVLREAITRRHWMGLIVGIAGIALWSFPSLRWRRPAESRCSTTAVTVLGAACISFGTVYQKRFATGVALASGGAWQYAGAVIVVGLGASLTEEFRFDGSFNAWFAFFWSVLVLSIGAISLLMLLIRHGDVSRVSGLIFLVPAVSALMAYFLFGETLNWIQIIGDGRMRGGGADCDGKDEMKAVLCKAYGPPQSLVLE